MPKYNTYPFKTSPESGDTVLIYDATNQKNKQTYFSNFLTWLVTEIRSFSFTFLQTSSKTIEGSINEVKSTADSTASYVALTQAQINLLIGLLS